jgi:cell wall-associated NlpC family hydrolase
VLTPPDLPVLAPAAVEDVGVGRKVADVALKFQGIPYVYGGNTIFGFDCSGFTKAMYSLAGVSIPRVAQDQFGYGRPVLREDIQPGDLVFFGTGPDNISHVGMAIGDGKFVHAPRTGLDITTTSLDSDYYSARFQGARRPYAQTLLAGSGTPATTASTGSSEHNAY